MKLETPQGAPVTAPDVDRHAIPPPPPIWRPFDPRRPAEPRDTEPSPPPAVTERAEPAVSAVAGEG